MEYHIEIDKQDIPDVKYKSRPFPGRQLPKRDRRSHGNFLGMGLRASVDTIVKNRQNLGIEADKLLAFELTSGVATPDINLLQQKFKVIIVEEVQRNKDSLKLVVQFNSKDDIDAFERERILYENNSSETGLFAPGQRKDFFDRINEIRPLTPEDRTGKKLLKAITENNLSDGLFIVDIDVWYNGNIKDKNEIQGRVARALGTGESTLLGDLFVLPSLLLGRAKVNRYTLESLRNLDLIAMVDFPIGTLSYSHGEQYPENIIPVIDNKLDNTAPLACVVDSGVFSGNVLLSSLIVGEEDFDITEETPSDLNGHGTGVAGIVAYGDFHGYNDANKVFTPLVRICNAKVMHNENENPSYGTDKRPEQIVDEAIRYFHKEYHCRIFNLSSGDANRVYNGGRQMAWASQLDNLARELDIVIVVSAGNVNNPEIPAFTNREELMSKVRDQLLTNEHRLIDPATMALGITVGSITRYGEPESFPQRAVFLSAGQANYPSAFTRTGDGVSGAIKPEFVDYGGNLAIRQLTATQISWQNNRSLHEPTLSNDITRVFVGKYGTSFAAPHVTHIAARLERALQTQIGGEPSANLIRALMASSARYYEPDWLNGATPPDFQPGSNRQTQSWRLRISGYGKVCDDIALFSDRNHVSLFAEDTLSLRHIHLYKIPVPEAFLNLRANKRIAIGFAYNPPTQLSRKAYIANSLWFEVFRHVDDEMLLEIKAKIEDIYGNAEDDKEERVIEKYHNKYGAHFKPGYTKIKNSTLQQCVWEKGERGGSDLRWENNEPCIHILVTGKERFEHPATHEAQPYALAVTFTYENDEDIQLRQRLFERVRVKQRAQVRIRSQVQV